ncbi:methyltransferase domain-containing protein [Paracoccus sp. IB05]|uniref:methyltransferase domain-containing protein n=1 Tax=Paracoccus sp. IB05 TaxID=2779367 RepID=UPI0018E889CE|nr:methyltransferase domain-containing protein [Paracoccus sp. IB05]MBJ2153043.1 methyltransferase domain-containing protein [Paracoccus sp. IB05]
MMMARIAAEFSRHHHSYEGAALAQARIAGRLAEGIFSHISTARRVLELGHGTGLLTRQLARLCPEDIWLNDLVAPLPQLAWPGHGRVYPLPGDAAACDFPRDLDLLASASMLQWIADPRALLAKAGQALRPAGLLALSGFGPDNFPEFSGWGLPRGAPSYLNAAGICDALPAAMEVLVFRDEAITLQFESAEDLFAHLRASGVNGFAAGRLAPGRLRGLLREINAAGPPTLTYRPSYCIARRS